MLDKFVPSFTSDIRKEIFNKYRELCIALLLFPVLCQLSCRKLVEIDPPVNSITTAEAFSSDADATSAITGLYSSLINTGGSVYFGCGAVTLFCGLSSDELSRFNAEPMINQFYINSLQADNGTIQSLFWNQPYNFIYHTNAILEGLQASSTVSVSTKERLIGEAKFLRAFFYFYLVNLYGDIPYVTSTNWQKTASVGRSSKVKIYEYLVADLKEAMDLLPDDYSYTNGQRIRVNKWGAAALLARVYLYIGDYVNAEALATSVINNSSIYSLNPNLRDVFTKNNPESILQLELNTSFGIYNATPEGAVLIPFDSTLNPSFYLTEQLLDGFEPGDLRRKEWVSSTTYEGMVYYYPYKYKIGPAQQIPNSIASEYYMILRLAEQYLIRAEASARQSKLNPAIGDLNLIRERAGLPYLPNSIGRDELIAAVEQERKMELFAEWGHRWLDLKRTGRADVVLRQVKGANWQETDQLYPIPLSELQRGPNLTQNEGY